MAWPWASVSENVAFLVLRVHLPRTILPSRRTQAVVEPVVTSSGEGLPSTSRRPVLSMFTRRITTLVALIRWPLARVSGRPPWVRSHAPLAQVHWALAAGHDM